MQYNKFDLENIIYGFLAAVFSSLFIYLSYFDIQNAFLNSLLGLLFIYFVLKIPKKALFYSGFFIGIFWFWWISLSFKYYDLAWMQPIIIIAIGLFYGLLFYLMALIDKPYFRALALLGLSFVEPFGFNWFKPELLFIESFFGTSKLSFALILLSIYLFVQKYKKLSLIPLLLAINFTPSTGHNPPLTVYMPQYNVKQENKWKRSNRELLIEQNLRHIKYAKKQQYDLVILPETAFPTVLNSKNNESLVNELKEHSKDIAIVTGALYQKNNGYYNSTYLFDNEKIEVAHKVVLVPFGEAVPLPQKIRDWINDTFYEGAEDYKTALYPTDFNIRGVTFRNAICFEATKDEIYKNPPNFIIAISNNAWFTPSIEPTLQQLLLKYYAKKTGTTIFSSANGGKNAIIQ